MKNKKICRNGRGTERAHSVPFRSEFNIALNHKGHEGMTYPNTLFQDTLTAEGGGATQTYRCLTADPSTALPPKRKKGLGSSSAHTTRFGQNDGRSPAILLAQVQ